MDWLCPGYSEVLARQINSFHGRLTADVIIREVVSIEQSGSLHIAVYDMTKDFVYIATARGSGESGPLDAYDRSRNSQYLNVTKIPLWFPVFEQAHCNPCLPCMWARVSFTNHKRWLKGGHIYDSWHMSAVQHVFNLQGQIYFLRYVVFALLLHRKTQQTPSCSKWIFRNCFCFLQDFMHQVQMYLDLNSLQHRTVSHTTAKSDIESNLS